VRRWRHERGLTLSDLATGSGLNLGYLSQIENDKAVPSLDALAGIADALDVPLAWLFLDHSSPPRVVRAGEREIRTHEDGGRVSDVDARTARDLRILEAEVPPGRSTGMHAHGGDEHHLVLAGRFRMTQGDHQAELGPGDYLAWDAAIPHDVVCVGPEVGRMLLIYPRRGGAPGDRGATKPGATPAAVSSSRGGRGR
jgi:transcriptional regulator with XRE-family HTH domain